MLRFQVDRFYKVTTLITRLRELVDDSTGKVKEGPPESARKVITQNLDALDALLTELGLSLAKKSVTKIRPYFKVQDPKNFDQKRCHEAIKELDGRIRDGLEDSFLLCLSSDNLSLFEPKEPLFGNEVHSNFESSRYDISEIGKCLALGRSTAAVMHSMRALEPALTCMAKEAGYAPKRENWGDAIDEIEKRLNPANANYITDKGKRELLAPAAVQFRHFKDAWRNHAMHAREKYTPEEADIVYRAVRSFMMHLAQKGLKE